MLLNSTPDTTGLIPSGDVKLYGEFGKEISRRFDTPLYAFEDTSGTYLEMEFKTPETINHIILKEDYREGHRIREYLIEGLTERGWTELASGSAAGRMKIDHFGDVSVSKVRLKITKNTAVPLIRSLSVYNVAGYVFKPEEYATNEWKQCGTWDTKTFVNGKVSQSVDLSQFVTKPGQYEVVFTSSVVITGMKVIKAKIFFDNDKQTQQSFVKRKGDSNTFYINRTAQVADGSSSILEVEMSSDNAVFQNRGEIRIRERGAGEER